MKHVSAKRVAIFVVRMSNRHGCGFRYYSCSSECAGMVAAVNVGVYSDAACTLNLTSIDWGNVYPGGIVPRLIYAKRSGNAPITLSMTTTSWNPAIAAGQITVAWERENAVLNGLISQNKTKHRKQRNKPIPSQFQNSLFLL